MNTKTLILLITILLVGALVVYEFSRPRPGHITLPAGGNYLGPANYPK